MLRSRGTVVRKMILFVAIVMAIGYVIEINNSREVYKDKEKIFQQLQEDYLKFLRSRIQGVDV